jgi:hypothetical protein
MRRGSRDEVFSGLQPMTGVDRRAQDDAVVGDEVADILGSSLIDVDVGTLERRRDRMGDFSRRVVARRGSACVLRSSRI